MSDVTEQMEEYLETVYRLEVAEGVARTGRIATELKVAPASVTDMLQKLERAELVEYEPYKGVHVTDSGREVAKRILGRHRVMQAFLQEVCGMDHGKAHDAACDMEHFIPPELDAWMAEYLKQVLGRPIDRDRKVRHQIGPEAEP